MILLVASDKDTASLNIKHQILNYYPFNESKESFQQKPLYHAQINGQIVTLVTLNEESVSAQNLPEQFPVRKLDRVYFKA